MKRYLLVAAVAALAAVAAATLYAQSRPAPALDGEPYIHDPSTVTFCDGKFYTFGTGGGGLMSDDGWTWRSGAVRPGGGVAPDVIHIGTRYYVTYARGGGGMSGGHASNVYVMWTKTLDPNSPDFGFHDETIVASSDGVEDCDAIDPAFLLDPRPDGCGSAMGPSSATSASSSSIPRRASAWPATRPSTSPSTWRRRR